MQRDDEDTKKIRYQKQKKSGVDFVDVGYGFREVNDEAIQSLSRMMRRSRLRKGDTGRS